MDIRHFFIILFLIIGCLGLCAAGAEKGQRIEHIVKQVQKEIRPLDLSIIPEHTDPETEFFKYYGISFQNTRHYFGEFKSGDDTIAGHVFIPEEPKGTVFILHGYYDHTGILRNLIKSCLKKGYAVASYDLPGHGISSGTRASIQDFKDYVTTFDNFISMFSPGLPQPHHFIGHSTGCSVAYDYLNGKGKKAFDKIIFLAPMVHNAHWKLSRTGHFIFSPIFKNVPRKFRKNSSNPDFHKFLKKDPLQAKTVPSQWLKALYKWNKKIINYKTVSHPVLIIQGTKDNVVDWKYNIPFLKKKIKPVKVNYIDGGGHQLLNEKEDLKSKVLSQINMYIANEQ